MKNIPATVVTELSQEEVSVLMIAAQGETLAPIGQWKQPIETLVMRGLMKRINDANYGITPEGRLAVHMREQEDDSRLLAAVNKRLTAQHTQANIVKFAEQAAQLLAMSGRASAEVTGDTPEDAARRWSQVILTRALELLAQEPQPSN